MSDWQSWDDRELAEQVLTEGQLRVLMLHIEGRGRRAGANMLGISEESYRRRLARALATIERAKQVLT